MGLAVNHSKMITEFNLELPNFYAAINGEVHVFKHYGAGKDALKPPTYFVIADFGVWPNKAARDAKVRPLTVDRTAAGPFDVAPTDNIYELVYNKYKSQWRYFVDDN
jgi:hypothetical protein